MLGITSSMLKHVCVCVYVCGVNGVCVVSDVCFIFVVWCVLVMGSGCVGGRASSLCFPMAFSQAAGQ